MYVPLRIAVTHTSFDVTILRSRRHTKMGKSTALNLLSLHQVRIQENVYSSMATSTGVCSSHTLVHDCISLIGLFRKDEIPTPQLNPKKKVFETIQPGDFNLFHQKDSTVGIDRYFLPAFSSQGFTTLENRDAAWVDPSTGTPYRIITKDGPCRPKTFVGATLS